MNNITKAQLKHVIRPVTYALLLAIPQGLNTIELSYYLNSTPGIKKYKPTEEKIRSILKSYIPKGNSVFIQRGDTWFIRDLVGGYIV